MKDRFSSYAKQYAAFRPGYPDSLGRFLVSQTAGRNAAWDAATGNGQMAVKLAPFFSKLYATDISARQIENAPRSDNIEYVVAPAERTGFKEHTFDLISVAQAIHWFDIPAFYAEAGRVAKPGALIAIIGYSLLRSGGSFNQILDRFYFEVIYPYWDAERKLVDDCYTTLAFPFEEIPLPEFTMRYGWSRDEVRGYVTTWSAVQKYIRTHHSDPVAELMKELDSCWHSKKLEVYFPIFGRIGLVQSA